MSAYMLDHLFKDISSATLKTISLTFEASMTTTAANASASPSTSNDSLMHDTNNASAPSNLDPATNPSPLQHHQNQKGQSSKPEQQAHKSPSSSAVASPANSSSSGSSLSSPSSNSQQHPAYLAKSTPAGSPPHTSGSTATTSSPQQQPQPPPTSATHPSHTTQATDQFKQAQPLPSSTPPQTSSRSSSPHQQTEEQHPTQANQQQSSTTNNNINKQQHQSAINEQKRPMNAFLLFCKKQRSLVREQYPNLENREITKILGDWWTKLDSEQRRKYTDLARQNKEAFMKANPDFKWCKTPISHNNNNSNSNTNSNSNSNDCYATNNRHHQQHHAPNNVNHIHHQTNMPEQLQHAVPMEIVQTNNTDALTSRQVEAPKPPKKRFLERNDSIYTNSTISPLSSAASLTASSKTNNTSNSEPNSKDKDGVVPYISLDQDTLDRVIDEAFSEKSSNSSPLDINMCKCSNRISTNLTTSSLGVLQSTTTTTFSTAPASYSTSVDEPVDFSMNRTINATRQQIINNLVEKMYSEPIDNAISISKINGTDNVQSHPGPPMKRGSPDHT